MDAINIKKLADLFYEDIQLHSDLFTCLKKEQAALINIDLDRLWPLAQEKQSIAVKISKTKKQIGEYLSEKAAKLPLSLDGLLSSIPTDKRGQFQKLYLNVVRLENEVHKLRDENILHIKDSLSFLDEMIALISGRQSGSITYTNKSHMKKNRNQMLLRREV